MIDSSKCAILTPIARYVEHRTNSALAKLPNQDYELYDTWGCASVDYARSILATVVLSLGYEELFWIDSDMVFTQSDVERIRSHNLPIVSAVCCKKSRDGGLATQFKDSSKEIKLGVGGGLIEIINCGCAFLYTKRIVYEDMKRMLNLPDCASSVENLPLTPYFLPMIIPGEKGLSKYLGEDLAFCHRARQCGYKLYADTSVRIEHIGNYGYSFEDIAGERDRFETVVYEFKDQK